MIKIPENQLSEEAKTEIKDILKREKGLNRKKLLYVRIRDTYNFRQFYKIRSFARQIYN